MPRKYTARQYTIKINPSTNEAKTVQASTLLKGEVFDRSDSIGVYMVVEKPQPSGQMDVVNLQTGHVFPVPTNELVYPVKATLNYNRIQGD